MGRCSHRQGKRPDRLRAICDARATCENEHSRKRENALETTAARRAAPALSSRTFNLVTRDRAATLARHRCLFASRARTFLLRRERAWTSLQRRHVAAI